VMASIRLAVGDSVCRTDHAEYQQSQSKRYEKRREDASHSQGKFFHLIGSPILSLIDCDTFSSSNRPERGVWTELISILAFPSLSFDLTVSLWLHTGRSSLTILRNVAGAWVGFQPLILKGERSGLWTGTETTKGVLLCERMKS
jgi:hypothetical protein